MHTRRPRSHDAGDCLPGADHEGKLSLRSLTKRFSHICCTWQYGT